MRYLVFVLFFLAGSSFSQMPPIESGVSQDLAKWRAARYSDVRYKLDLTLEKMSPVLKGTIEIRLNVRDAAIVLDWRKIRGFEERSTVSNVLVNGAARPFEESNEHLIFRDGVVEGENVVKLDFTSPILGSGSAITRYVDKEDGSEYIYSLFVPSDASTAFPVFDQPDLKARFTLSMIAPKSWQVVSNTTVDSVVTRDGACPTQFQLDKSSGSTAAPSSLPCELLDANLFSETKPISTYVFAFAAGPWQRVSAPSDSPPCLGGVDAASAAGVVVKKESDSCLTTTPPRKASAPLLNKGNNILDTPSVLVHTSLT